MNKKVIAFLNEALQSGKTAALATLTASGRDTPGVTGGMMVVLSDGRRCGTIGGGAVEAAVIRRCEEELASGASGSFIFDYSLTKDGQLGMACGGEVSGFVNILRPNNRLLVFGGGHVGKKIYEAGLVCGFEVLVIEDREEYAFQFPEGSHWLAESFAQAAAEIQTDSSTYAVIVTRGHAHDYVVLREMVRKPLAYIGMIGSRVKVAESLQKLREEGVPQENLDCVYAPIGLQIDDGSPGEIATAILAEMLAVKNQGKLAHSKDKRKDLAKQS